MFTFIFQKISIVKKFYNPSFCFSVVIDKRKVLQFTKFELVYTIPLEHADWLFSRRKASAGTIIISIQDLILDSLKGNLTACDPCSYVCFSKKPFQIVSLSSSQNGNNFEISCQLDRRIHTRKKNPFTVCYYKGMNNFKIVPALTILPLRSVSKK